MVNYIFGKKGCGKTTLCLDIASKKIKEKQQTFFIVPEQEAVKAERKITDLLGNQSNLYVEVINFRRLCNRVFREAGGLARGHVDSAGRLLVLAKVQEDCADILKTYKNCSDDTGFTKKLSDIIGNFQNSGASPSALMKLSQNFSDNPETKLLSDKLFDLSLIYGTYKEAIEETFGCESDLLEVLSDTLESYHFFADKTVIIDSFYGFTQSETDIIKKIIKSAKDVYITFNWDGKSRDKLYQRSIRSYEALKDFCQNGNIKFDNTFLTHNYRHKQNSGLYILENLFAEDCLKTKKDTPFKDDINIISCPDIYKECSYASNIIHHLIKKGAKYRDICICVPDTERYSGIIDTAFEKQNIPFYMSCREKLTEKPVISLLFSSFNIYISGFSRNHIIRFIKSGLCGLDFHGANILDRYIRTWNLSGKRFSAGNWDMSPSGYCENMSDEEKDELLNVNRAGQAVLDVINPFCGALKAGKVAFDYCKAVYDFLTTVAEINSSDPNFEQENAVYYKMIYDCLDVFCAVMKDKKLSVKRFFKLFELIITQFDTGRIPSSLDEVEIAPVSLLRSDNVKHVIILGVNEGVLPALSSGSVFFADEEKKLLESENIYLSPDSTDEIYDSLFLCMCACLSASESLYILYSEKDLSGQKLNHSVFVSFLQNIFCGNTISRVPFENPLENLGNHDSAFEELFTFEDNLLRQSLINYFSSKPEYADRIKLSDNGPVTEKKLTRETSEKLFGEKIVSSVTRLETFNRCPFSYFSRYTLALRPEPKATLGPSEIGNISHRVMEIFCKKLAAKKIADGCSFTEEQAEEIMKEILSQYLDMFLHSKSNVSKRFLFLYNRISRTVIALAKSITREMAQSLFTPSDFELRIEKNGDIPSAPIIVEKNGKSQATLEIIGQIDRVDTYEADGKSFVRIVDYKTGTKNFNKEEIAYGLNLQMLLYLFTVLHSGKEKYGEKIIPCAVLYIPSVSPDEKIFLGQSASVTDFPFTAKGIVISDMNIIRAMERDVSGLYIPVTLKQNGEFTARSSVASHEEMSELIESAAQVAAELAKEIMTGDISVSPYKCDEINSCAFCDYVGFCGYDREIHSPRYELKKKIPDRK